MFVAFDTSALVPAVLRVHPHHASSLHLIEQITSGKHQGMVSCHSLAEFYAVVTPISLEYRLTPDQAIEMIEKNILHWFEVIELTLEDYRGALKRVKERSLGSGAIYDALVYQTALKKKVSCLVTWNEKHFRRISGGELEIVTPESFR